MSSRNKINSYQAKRQHKLSIIGIIFCLVVLAVVVIGFINRQWIIDQITVAKYQPSESIEYLADRIDFSSKGEFLFYASQPSLEEAKAFNQYCANYEISMAILGCYTNKTIYIYDVADDQLDGIKEVTAAHEMLHAAYERLSSWEKNRVNNLLDTEYIKLLDDESLQTRMQYYDYTEPGQKYNELHSIIGTEIASISPELEDYYARYFDDRSKIVSLNEQYSKIFEQLEAQASQLSSQLNSLFAQIESQTESYNQQVLDLNSDISQFNAKAQSGGFSSQSEFNSQRDELIRRINQLDITRDNINQQVIYYNNLLEDYNAITTQSKDLYQSINSNLTEVNSI